MPESPLNVLAIVGSLHRESVTRTVINLTADRFQTAGCVVDMLDLQAEPLPLYNPDTAYDTPAFVALQARVDRADVLVLGTPDYHGSISSALKNFLDHFWHEFAGKLFATMVASHEKSPPRPCNCIRIAPSLLTMPPPPHWKKPIITGGFSRTSRSGKTSKRRI